MEWLKQNELVKTLIEPSHCSILKLIGGLLAVLFMASVIFNSVSLLLFLRFKSLRSSRNHMTIAIVTVNFIGTFAQLPFVIVSALNCEWGFGFEECAAIGFLMYFIGCTSIYLIVGISIERVYIISYPVMTRKLDPKVIKSFIITSVLLGLFWPSLPLLGWSHYSYEGINISCSIEWNEPTLNVISYNMTILLAVFLMPLLVILIINLRLIFLLKRLTGLAANMLVGSQMKKRLTNERELTVRTIILVGTFIACWTPYAAVCIYSLFVKPVGPYVASIPALFAKSSLLWTSVVFMTNNKNLKKALKNPSSFSNRRDPLL
nr:G protein-coupled receptor [Proales similis]